MSGKGLNGAGARCDYLWRRSLVDDITDEELAEFERLQVEHPEWEPRDDDEAAFTPPPVPLYPPPPPPSSTALVPLERKTDVFTANELERIAASQGCTVAGLRNRWIIRRGNCFYILGQRGEYLAPISLGELDVSLPRDLGRVPSPPDPCRYDEEPPGTISWTYKKKGEEEPVEKPTATLLKHYSSVARHVVASFAIPWTTYDPLTETIYERICPVRSDLVPKYHPDVDKWLDLLGGPVAGKLKDWIATSTLTERITCAIYLHGVKDVGKNMLASGLARQWSEAPTDMSAAVADFNSALADCPLVFADERLPKKMTSEDFRAIVGADRRGLRRKGMPEAPLIGALRVIIAANNANAIAFPNEDFDPNDIAAVAGRVLYVGSSPEAAEFLRSLGGRGGTDGWVQGDMIAEHALWLRDNRKVVPGSRYLVEGEVADIHRRLAANGTVRSLVIEWTCKAILEKNWGAVPGVKRDEHSLGIQFGGGHIYVNASFVKNNWQKILGENEKLPSLVKIGQALRPLAIVDKTGQPIERRMKMGDGRADFYAINPEHVYAASKDLQIATVGRFKKLIESERAFLDLVGEEGEPPPIPGVEVLANVSALPGASVGRVQK